MSLEYFLQVFVSGFTRGSIYALIALGYTMVYGIIQLINFAHGEIYMIGAFSLLILIGVLSMLNLPVLALILIAVLVSILYSAGYGFTIERLAYRQIRNAQRLSLLISAIGMSMFLQNYVLLAQTSSFLYFPKFLEDIPLFQNTNILNASQAVIFSATALIMILLTVFVRYTRTGKAMRALSQDRTMAVLVGVPTNRTISITFIIGSITAAIGGGLVSAQIGQIHFYMGFIAGIKAFVAAVLGGIGNIPGAVLGSFILGLTESFGTTLISSDYEDVFAFIILILILIVKPSGLLGKNRSEKV